MVLLSCPAHLLPVTHMKVFSFSIWPLCGSLLSSHIYLKPWGWTSSSPKYKFLDVICERVSLCQSKMFSFKGNLFFQSDNGRTFQNINFIGLAGMTGRKFVLCQLGTLWHFSGLEINLTITPEWKTILRLQHDINNFWKKKPQKTNSAVNMYVIRISDSLVNSLCMSRQKPAESSSPPPVAPRQGRLYDLFQLALVGRGFPCWLSACLMAFASLLCCNTYGGGNHNT